MMADDADVALGIQEMALAQSLADHQAQAAHHSRPLATGYCLNPRCCDDLEGDRLFCGPECAKEYEAYKK